jgi:hypothetical protein
MCAIPFAHTPVNVPDDPMTEIDRLLRWVERRPAGQAVSVQVAKRLAGVVRQLQRQRSAA